MGVNEVDYVKIGQRIRKVRTEQRLQQAELAYRAGITTSHMSHIETAQTKLALPTIVKIANALFVSVDELLYDSLEQVRPVYVIRGLRKRCLTAIQMNFRPCLK